MVKKFYVGISKDFLNPNGDLINDIGLELLSENSRVDYSFVNFSRFCTNEELSGLDVIMINANTKINADTLSGENKLIAIAKFGAGYDNIETKVCTENDVMVFNTPEGVKRPVAIAILTYLLALSTRAFTKDRLVRNGEWSQRGKHTGVGLKNKVIGSIGLGGIAREFFKISKPLEMKRIAYDPYVAYEDAASLGVELVDLDYLLKESDFVCINCPLSESTFHLIGKRELGLMKPTAFLINTARGAVVDEKALIEALTNGTIQGAGLDTFEQEPIDINNPLLKLNNVILAPHGLAHTDELYRSNGEGCMRRILQIAECIIPDSVINKEVLKREQFIKKLEQFA